MSIVVKAVDDVLSIVRESNQLTQLPDGKLKIFIDNEDEFLSLLANDGTSGEYVEFVKDQADAVIDALSVNYNASDFY